MSLPDRIEHPGGGVTFPRHIERVLYARQLWNDWHDAPPAAENYYWNHYREPRTLLGRFRRALRQLSRPGELV